jgi:SAM-dependent methyltransferase
MKTSMRFSALVLLLAICAIAQTPAQPRKPDVIYLPTPQPVVEEMLRMAEVDANDVVYDLGCGDGRTVITAAKMFGARGVGIDIDPQRIRESNENAKTAGVTGRVKFLEQDLFQSDIHEATAVTLYLLTTLNLKLRPILLQQLKPGTPIVSHDFGMGDWTPEQQKEVKSESRTHTVYRWTVPAKAAGTWELKVGPKARAYHLELAQNVDKIGGKVRANGREHAVLNGIVHGKTVSFELTNGGGRFEGTVEGNTMRGKWKGAGSGSAESATGKRTSEGTVASNQWTNP